VNDAGPQCCSPSSTQFNLVPSRKAGIWTAALLTGVIVCFHALRLAEAGGLWRDEAGAVQLATMPMAMDVIRYFPHEAFPLGFPTLVRTYVGIAGDSDMAWRIFGMGVGISIILALWLNMWVVRRGVPLLSLALLGFNGDFIQWGDSMRGYGPGIVLMLVTVALMWRVLEQPTHWRVAAAAFSAVASVQCLFHNAVLLLASCLGVIAVASRRGEKRQIALLLGIGVVAAASLLPYWGPLNKAQEWDMLIHYPVDLEYLCANLIVTLSASGWWNSWTWMFLFVLGGACSFGCQFRPP
jgi:hypothetical protein